jgi:AraC-like DNA-binding protein
MMGMRSTGRHLFTSPGGAIILAQFHAGGAAVFFDLPLHQLFDAASSLEELIEPREIEATSARIAKAESHEQRVTVLEQFLLMQRARIPRSEDRLVARVLHAIGADPGSFRVAPFAGKLGISVDALEKRFRRAVGASPKQLASIMRLRRAVEARDESSSLTRLAVDAGYYDQAHFVRHFKAVTGVAPRAFLASIADCV